jgi:lysophospholipase L1-like esterase
MISIKIFLLCFLVLLPAPAGAQTLDSSNFKIEWQVANRFRLFRDPEFFKLHESAWHEYVFNIGRLKLSTDGRADFINRTSVLGSEHVLNDRWVAFGDTPRKDFDWRGWAAGGEAKLCYDPDSRRHTGCGSIDDFLNPKSHEIELWLVPTGGVALAPTARCEWRIGGALVATAGCGEHVSGAEVSLPYPGGAEISVNVAGEQPIAVSASVRDILIASLGDSFASGEGNPNLPPEFGDAKRYHNLYPLRLQNHGGGSAVWSDQLCHRSLYGQNLRAALQIAVENRQLAITFLDYSCSGAGIDEGILGGQYYVEREIVPGGSAAPIAPQLSGGAKDAQIYRLLRELCLEKPEEKGGLWTCPDNKFRRNLDFVFLSVGGNDIGFSNVIAWASLRGGVSSAIAEFFGATVSADEFVRRMHDILPDSYARLAKAFETALPLYSAADNVFDPSRIVLTAYPDLVTNERGKLCEAYDGGNGAEDRFPANQSLDMFSSWLLAGQDRLVAVREQFSKLFVRMRELAEDHGWTFAGHAYADKMFEGHGFCARNPERADDPAEALIIPCWGKAPRETATCESSWSGKERQWRPYNPATQNFPYARRQRWVRTFNDAYMVVNQKVIDRAGTIDEKTSEAVFSETVGALHPTAEGHAAMADALLLSVRPMIQELIESSDPG